MNDIELVLKRGKETPNTIRYEAEHKDVAIPTIYIEKTAMEGEEPPAAVSIIVRAIK